MTRTIRLLPTLALALLACSDSPADVGTTALLSVIPADGAADVSVQPVIEIRFDAPLASGATMLVALQLGDCPGPVVAGTWSLSPDGRVLSFAPAQPLHAGTRYSIHLGGGMTDAGGDVVDIGSGPGLGGMWVTEMMVMGMGGMGMGGMPAHAGPGWRGPNGFYGLAFAFATGG